MGAKEYMQVRHEVPTLRFRASPLPRDLLHGQWTTSSIPRSQK